MKRFLDCTASDFEKMTKDEFCVIIKSTDNRFARQAAKAEERMIKYNEKNIFEAVCKAPGQKWNCG